MSQELARIEALEKRVSALESRDTVAIKSRDTGGIKCRDTGGYIDQRQQAQRILARLPNRAIGEPIDGRGFGW